MGSPSCPQSPAELSAQGRNTVATGPMKVAQSTLMQPSQMMEGTLCSAVQRGLTGRRNHKGKCCWGLGR